MALEIKTLLELVGIHVPDELLLAPVQDGAITPDPTSESSGALDELMTLISGGALRHHPDTASLMTGVIPGLIVDSRPLERKAILRGILVGAVAGASTMAGITLKKGLKAVLSALDHPAAVDTTEKIIPFALIQGVETNHLIKLYGRFIDSIHILENYLVGLVNGNNASDFKQAIEFLNARADVREVFLIGEDPIAFATKPPEPAVIPLIDIPETLTFVPHVHPDFKPLEFTLSRQGRPMKVIIERVDFDTALKLIPSKYGHELLDNADNLLPPHLEPFILLVRALDGTVEGLVVSLIVKEANGRASMSCNRWFKFDRKKETGIADMGMAMIVAQLHYMDTKGYLHDTIVKGYLQPVLHNINLALLNTYRKLWNFPVEHGHPSMMMTQPVAGINAEEGRFYLEKSGLKFTEVVLATPAVLAKAADYLGIVDSKKGISWDPETRINTTHLVTQLQLDTGLKLSFGRCELDALALASALIRSGHTGVKILEISLPLTDILQESTDTGLWHFFSVWQNNVAQATNYTGNIHYAVIVDNQVYDLQSRLRAALPLETYLSLSFPDQGLKTKTYLPNELRKKLRTSRKYHWARHNGFQKFPALIYDELEPKPEEPVAKFRTLKEIIAAGRKNVEPLAQLVVLDNSTPSHHFPSYMITGSYENNLDSLIPHDGTTKRFWITPSNIMPMERFVDSPPATKLNFYNSVPRNRPEKFAVI
ncbi:MAG: hypothetical protein ACD_73C00171G0002, partial [uncultured bacterium]